MFDIPREQREHKGNRLEYLPTDYCVVNIETTGYDPFFSDILEITAIKVRNNEVISEFSSLVKPPMKIDNYIEKLTLLTNELLENAPSIEIVLPMFYDFLSNDIIVGHNVHYDINFLYDNLLRKFNIPLSNDFFDTLRFSRKLYKELENHKLITIAQLLQIEIPTVTCSLNSCYIVQDCYKKMQEHITNNSIDLKELFKQKRSLHSNNRSSSKPKLGSIVPTVDDFDEDNLFFDMHCVFTGTLEKMKRADAIQLLVNLGGTFENTVTKKTNFLILGNLDYASSITDGKSTKLKKAESLMLSGQDLTILSENTFYDLVNAD